MQMKGKGDKGFSAVKKVHRQKGGSVMTSNKGPAVYQGSTGSIRNPNSPHFTNKAG